MEPSSELEKSQQDTKLLKQVLVGGRGLQEDRGTGWIHSILHCPKRLGNVSLSLNFNLGEGSYLVPLEPGPLGGSSLILSFWTFMGKLAIQL